MKKLWGALISAGLLTAMTMGPASANVVFSVSGIAASTSGGPALDLSGTFTTDNTFQNVISADIITPATGAYTGFEYIFNLPGANSSNFSSLPARFLRFDTPGSVDELQIALVSLLNASGATLSSNSYNNLTQQPGAFQTLTGNITPAVTAVPEPLTLSLFGAGLAGAAMLRRPKVRKA